MSDTTRSRLNPYAPPESEADAPQPAGRRTPRILAALVVFPAISVGVIVLIVKPPLGLALLVLTHLFDRWLFNGPPFLRRPGIGPVVDLTLDH